MSSLYRDQSHPRKLRGSACTFLVLFAAGLGPALAADTYVQPRVDLRFETNDNFNFVPGGDPDSNVYGYLADFQALIGIATPRSDTSIRPRVKFQEYPDRDDFEKVEAFFDLNSLYRWERGQLRTIGRYSRQDDYNAETPGGEFDPDDPGDPNNADSGTIIIGETRSKYQILPEIVFDVTERTQIGGDLEYSAVRYESDIANTHTDYDFYGGSGFFRWAMSPQSDITVGAYANKYEATDNSTETDAFGGRFGYAYRWSENSGMALEVIYEQDDTTDFVPVTVEDSTSGFGGELSAYHRGEVSRWRLAVGRTFIATGASGKAESDQLRLQYDRDLSQRLSLLAAARFESRNSLATGGQGNDRDYARGDFSLRWMMTQTWYLQGGYSYIWQDRESATGSADNNKFFVSFGYNALDRKRR